MAAWWAGKEKKPLVLRGARQVGKSTLVRLFCEAHNLVLHEINLETTRLHSLESLESFDVDLVIAEVEAKTRTAYSVERSVIFLDEIQANPTALQALRYLYESRRVCVVAAGSLLEFVLDDHSFAMPVGRLEFLHLGPMTFFEFLRAIGDETLAENLSSLDRRLWSLHHADVVTKMRAYFFVGGMPEAVAVYARTKSVLEVSRVHAALLQTYKADFAKYRTRVGFDSLSRIFDKLPRALGQKIKYARLIPDEPSRTVSKVIDLFVKAKLLTKCEHTTASGLPLAAQASEDVYKLYFLDIGLLHHAMQLDADQVMFEDADLLTRGLSAEQFAAQHLAYAGAFYAEPKLYYWLKDKDPQKAEIDFLLGVRAQVVPVEVKAGKTGTLKSLAHFMHVHPGHPLAIRMDALHRQPSEYEEKRSFRLLNVPLFMAEKIEDIARSALMEAR